MQFVGNLILSTSREFYEEDDTMTLFMTSFSNTKCGEVRTKLVL